MLFVTIKTPIGIMKIVGDCDGIAALTFLEESADVSNEIPALFADVVSELNDYFEGKLDHFTMKLNLKGTAFQQMVWHEIKKIPFGKSTTYLNVAKSVGDVKAIRAVAAAIGKNPFLIVLPCHRVIGSNGALTGFSGGIWRKKWLLEHENALKQQSLF